MKCYAISDMHGQFDGLDPKGADLVLIAGDFARLERLDFIGVCNQVDWIRRKFCAWCAVYPQTRFRIVPGNHDLFAQEPQFLAATIGRSFSRMRMARQPRFAMSRA